MVLSEKTLYSVGRRWVYIFNRRKAKKLIPAQCNLAVGALVLARAQPVPVAGRLHAQGLAPSGARNRALEPVSVNIEFPLSPVFLYPDRPTHANEHVG